MLRKFFVIYFFLVVLLVSALGFRGCKSSNQPIEIFPDMDRQAKFLEQAENNFFEDGRNDRPKVAGTIPYVTDKEENYSNLMPDHRYRENAYLATGYNADEDFGRGFPIETNREAMERGQELYNIYCTICHGASGDGNGVLKNPRFGFATIQSLQQSRLIEMTEGEIFNTITYGKNTMGSYGARIRVEDRWKIILYVRALQRAATATVDDVPAEHLGDLGI